MVIDHRKQLRQDRKIENPLLPGAAHIGGHHLGDETHVSNFDKRKSGSLFCLRSRGRVSP